MKLNTKRIENAQCEDKTKKLFDGKGLYLELNKNGSKYWRYKYRYLNKEKLMSLGVYPEISLAEARNQHRIAHRMVSQGLNPIDVKREEISEKKKELRNTFEKIAREWMNTQRPSWSDRNFKIIRQRLERDAFPVLGNMPITSINHQMLLDLALNIQKRGANELAKRIIQTCKHIFQFAIINGYTDKNIASDLKGVIKTPPTRSYSAIDPKDIPKFLQAYEKHKYRLHRQTQIALELLMLTFVRTSELIKAEWGEFDLEEKQWVIPARRMKMRQEHIVPLSTQAVKLLKELQTLHRNNHWIFPSRTTSMNHMSNNTVLMALRRMGYAGIMTGHGFRSLAMTTIIERLNYNFDIPDAQLAHGKGGSVRKAYDRTKFLPQRKEMMQEWADYIDSMKA